MDGGADLLVNCRFSAARLSFAMDPNHLGSFFLPSRGFNRCLNAVLSSPAERNLRTGSSHCLLSESTIAASDVLRSPSALGSNNVRDLAFLPYRFANSTATKPPAECAIKWAVEIERALRTSVRSSTSFTKEYSSNGGGFGQ